MHIVIQPFTHPGKLALVGASDKPKSFGSIAYAILKQRGYELYPVNPNYQRVAGDRCYRSISELPNGIESAVFMLAPDAAAQAVAEAKTKGIRHIWFQQGGKYDAAIRAATDAGIEVVSKKCILMYAGEVTGVHAFHRFLTRLFGSYE